MNSRPFLGSPEQSQALALLCQQRASSELAHLEATLANLQRVRSALGAGEPDSLAGALHDAQAATAVFKTLELERRSFRDRAATFMKAMPETVTLGKAIDALPLPLAGPLRQLRDRLRRLAVEVDRVNQANALITWWRLDFIQQVFAGLPGVMSSGRYSRRGKLQTPVCGALWQGNG